MAELRDIVRAAGLGAGAEHRVLPAAEALPLHDRPGDVAIDVGIADCHLIGPLCDLIGVQAVQTTGQAEGGRVLPLDRLGQVLGLHQSQHRPENLGQVEERTRPHAGFQPGRPQATRLVQLLRGDQPGFARVKLGQGAQQLALRRFDDRAHRHLQIGGVTHLERAHRVDELAPEAFRRRDRAHQNAQGRRRALLAGVPEGAAHQVGDSQVKVGRRGHHQRVLAGGFTVDPRAARMTGAPIGEHGTGLA